MKNEECRCMNEERSSVKIVIVWLGAAEDEECECVKECKECNWVNG